MKKSLFLAALAAVAMMSTGCYFCGDPIDESCKGSSHAIGDDVIPDAMAYAQPVILPTSDVFIPRFEALDRVTNIEGVGNSLSDATANAIKAVKNVIDCDYVVVVNKQVETKTHPHWCWFLSTTNYIVTIDAIPVKLKSLEHMDAAAAKEAVAAAKEAAAIVNLKAEFKSEVKSEFKSEFKSEVKTEVAPACQHDAGIIKLSDIQVQINAKGESNDKAAVIYPVK